MLKDTVGWNYLMVTEIDKYGFYVPNHPRLKPEEIEYVCDIINARSYH